MGPGEYATQSGFFNGPVSQNLHARNIVRWTAILGTGQNCSFDTLRMSSFVQPLDFREPKAISPRRSRLWRQARRAI